MNVFEFKQFYNTTINLKKVPLILVEDESGDVDWICIHPLATNDFKITGTELRFEMSLQGEIKYVNLRYNEILDTKVEEYADVYPN